MTTVGQLCLLAAFVASGYAAFACLLGGRSERAWLRRAGAGTGAIGFAALTLVGVILAIALLYKDFRFAYVAEYASRSLTWYYALSAFWVGQAGSLLLWAWMVGLLAVIYRFWPRRNPSPLREPAFAILMVYQCFLVAMMVFGADPMRPSLVVPGDGAGLSPLLQHPAMLLHPPVVFLGYAGCAIPFALAAAALLTGRLDAGWLREARPWTFFAWIVLGIGILVGAYWAYEELGWGGYWSWDPVENGSLIPWLAVTALIHAAMAYRQRGVLKRTTLLLAVAGFAACNFAAFLTRSGIFSSLHTFSRSPIGWMFLVLIGGLSVGSGVLLRRRRVALASDGTFSGLMAKESVTAASVFVLILLTVAVLIGTVSMPVSDLFFRHTVLIGKGFYNGVLIPTGLMLLAAMAVAPLLRWGAPPEPRQRRVILIAVGVGLHVAGLGWLGGMGHPLAMGVVALAVATATAFFGSWALDARQTSTSTSWREFVSVLHSRRRTYAGYAMHLGLACLALGVAGSSLGTRQQEVTLRQNESTHWAGRDIRFVRLIQDQRPDKLVVQAELEVTAEGTTPYRLRPSQEYYALQGQWSTEVAIHSTWGSDFYAILHSGEGQDRVQLTLVENPMMRWMWLAGWLTVVGAVPWFWPTRRPAAVVSKNHTDRKRAAVPAAAKRARRSAA